MSTWELIQKTQLNDSAGKSINLGSSPSDSQAALKARQIVKFQGGTGILLDSRTINRTSHHHTEVDAMNLLTSYLEQPVKI